MIHSREDLKYYISEDLKRYVKKPTIKDWFLHNECWYLYNYIKN